MFLLSDGRLELQDCDTGAEADLRDDVLEALRWRVVLDCLHVLRDLDALVLRSVVPVAQTVDFLALEVLSHRQACEQQSELVSIYGLPLDEGQEDRALLGTYLEAVDHSGDLLSALIVVVAPGLAALDLVHRGVFEFEDHATADRAALLDVVVDGFDHSVQRHADERLVFSALEGTDSGDGRLLVRRAFAVVFDAGCAVELFAELADERKSGEGFADGAVEHLVLLGVDDVFFVYFLHA